MNVCELKQTCIIHSASIIYNFLFWRCNRYKMLMVLKKPKLKQSLAKWSGQTPSLNVVLVVVNHYSDASYKDKFGRKFDYETHPGSLWLCQPMCEPWSEDAWCGQCWWSHQSWCCHCVSLQPHRHSNVFPKEMQYQNKPVQSFRWEGSLEVNWDKTSSLAPMEAYVKPSFWKSNHNLFTISALGNRRCDPKYHSFQSLNIKYLVNCSVQTILTTLMGLNWHLSIRRGLSPATLTRTDTLVSMHTWKYELAHWICFLIKVSILSKWLHANWLCG